MSSNAPQIGQFTERIGLGLGNAIRIEAARDWALGQRDDWSPEVSRCGRTRPANQFPNQRARKASTAWARKTPMLKKTHTAVTTSVIALLPGSPCLEGRHWGIGGKSR
jgi:hypothetical protein